MNNTPSGMKINFDEQNMTEWEILMDGPEQSLYAVSARPESPNSTWALLTTYFT
jgi:hypothetical protein